MPSGKGDAERDDPQRGERGEGRDRDGDGDRPLGAREDRERDERCAGESRRDEIAGAGPAAALVGEVAYQRRDRQVLRPSERRDREGKRGQKPVGEPKQDDRGIDRRGERDRDDVGEQPVHGERDRGADRRAGKSAGESDDHELDHREQDDARSGRPDRLQDRERRPLALDEALRRIGDADAADNQRQETGQRQELGETIEVAGEIGRHVEARARLPAGLGERLVGFRDERLDGRLVGRAARTAHDDARCPADERSRAGPVRSLSGPPLKSARAARGRRRPPGGRVRCDDGAKDEFGLARDERRRRSSG